MVTNKHFVVIDSSALVALLVVSDADHKKAVAVLDTARPAAGNLLLPSEVMAETLNVIGKKHGKQTAHRSGGELLTLLGIGRFRLVHGATHTITQTLNLQLNATGGPSFTDCLVMALADEHHTSYVFGFDDTFRQNGYLLP